MKKLALILALAIILTSLCACKPEKENENEKEEKDTEILTVEDVKEIKVGQIGAEYENATVINLEKASATVNGSDIAEYDYQWHTDPTSVHDEVKNSPSEYFTGSLPEDHGDIYIDRELYYFPMLDTKEFKLINYDGEQEWAYYYKDGENDSFIYATLPHFGNEIPTYMMHSEAEAENNKVLHITKAGAYVLTGSWNGQIKIDLSGEPDDASKKVTLILNGAEINCTVAPGIVFDGLYECDNKWEESESHSYVSDLSDAGANLMIADGSENTVSGCNIYRMLKTKYKDGSDSVQKKMRKLDGALYSFVSMNISGGEKADGRLQINSNFEGLDSELHLAVNSGEIIIHSKDDGINVNEDNVSTFTLSGGRISISAGEGYEGDGIDSNGFATIKGGTLLISNVTAPDNALDTENGILYEGGEVYIDGRKKDLEKGKEYKEISAENQGMGKNAPPDGFMKNGEKKPDDMPFDKGPEILIFQNSVTESTACPIMQALKM